MQLDDIDVCFSQYLHLLTCLQRMNLEKFLPEVRILNFAGNATHPIVLLPKRQITFEVTFKPVVLGPMSTYLVFRNNITLVELVEVRGTGGKGMLSIGHVW